MTDGGWVTLTIERCGACHYYELREKECRRHAPTPHVVMVQNPSALSTGPDMAPMVMGIWPATRPECWCGEYRARASA